jgi:hypothetical protein
MPNPAATVDFVTMFRRDYDLLARMHTASSAALSCAELGDLSQPSRFRLFRQPSAPLVGVCPDRKQGLEEISHEYRTFGVCAARNVA